MAACLRGRNLILSRQNNLWEAAAVTPNRTRFSPASTARIAAVMLLRFRSIAAVKSLRFPSILTRRNIRLEVLCRVNPPDRDARLQDHSQITLKTVLGDSGLSCWRAQL